MLSKIKRRIKEIDEFYNINCMDQRIRFLQTARMNLMKLISKGPSTKYEKNSLSLPWKEPSKTSSRKDTTPRSFQKQKPDNKSQNNQIRPKVNGSLRQNINNDRLLQDNKIIKTSRQSQYGSKNIKTPVKASRKTQFITSKNKEATPNLLSQKKSTNINEPYRRKTESQSEADSMKKLNDLIFTIKMTKEQYQQFMDIKNKDRNT